MCKDRNPIFHRCNYWIENHSMCSFCSNCHQETLHEYAITMYVTINQSNNNCLEPSVNTLLRSLLLLQRRKWVRLAMVRWMDVFCASLMFQKARRSQTSYLLHKRNKIWQFIPDKMKKVYQIDKKIQMSADFCQTVFLATHYWCKKVYWASAYEGKGRLP